MNLVDPSPIIRNQVKITNNIILENTIHLLLVRAVAHVQGDNWLTHLILKAHIILNQGEFFTCQLLDDGAIDLFATDPLIFQQT